MLSRADLKSYLLDMPSGHIFDLTYRLLADVFPPGKSDPASRAQLQALADECGCDIVDNSDEERFELTRR